MKIKIKWKDKIYSKNKEHTFESDSIENLKQEFQNSLKDAIDNNYYFFTLHDFCFELIDFCDHRYDSNIKEKQKCFPKYEIIGI